MLCWAHLKILPTFWTGDPHFHLARSPAVTRLVLHPRTGDEDTDSQMTPDGGSPALLSDMLPLSHCHLGSVTTELHAMPPSPHWTPRLCLVQRAHFGSEIKGQTFLDELVSKDSVCDPDMTSMLSSDIRGNPLRSTNQRQLPDPSVHNQPLGGSHT